MVKISNDVIGGLRRDNRKEPSGDRSERKEAREEEDKEDRRRVRVRRKDGE